MPKKAVAHKDKCSCKNQVTTPGIRIFDVCLEPKERSGNCPENGTGQNDINSEAVTSNCNTGKLTKQQTSHAEESAESGAFPSTAASGAPEGKNV